MSNPPDDPWLDASFQRDSAVEAEQRALRRRHREVVQIPRLRALGNLWLFGTILLHNAVFLGAVRWRELLWFGAFQAAYVLGTSFSLQHHYRADARFDLGTLYLATDIAVFVLALYVSGGERSWLLPLLCVRVADQVGTSQRRALMFAHATLILHLALLLELAFVERRELSLLAELSKVLFVYVLNLYLGLAAGPSERQRTRATRLAQTTRQLIEELAAKTELLERERERAEAANRAKSRFLANMSHEIRTPMNGVLGAAELLVESGLAPAHRRMVETIASSGRALLAIVNDVLDMSKIEAGKLRLEQTGFQPVQLIEELALGLAPQAAQKSIELKVELCDEAETRVIGDPLRLRQVLTNLLGNALKFTQRGTVALAVRLMGRSASALTLRFDVEDTGIGMSPETVERMFVPFQQADDSTTRRFGGTGLGLSIAQQLVEMMGGKIDLDSQLGVGSRFGFELVLPIDPSQTHEAAQSEREQAEAELRAAAPHVLVAEDTPVNRTLVQKMLELLGCRVTTAEDGAQAVERLCVDHDFALVLMDWHMPKLDGLEATRRVRAWEETHAPGRRTPIIAFTASAFAEEAAHCREAGMDGILVKPITKAQLLRVLHEQLANGGPPLPEVPAVAAPEPGSPASGPLRNSQIEELLELDAATPGGFLAGVVTSFLDAAPERFEELELAIRTGDTARVEQLAHRFKGSAANLGAVRLMEPLLEIERGARAGSLAGANDALARARIEYTVASAPLRAIVAALERQSADNAESVEP